MRSYESKSKRRKPEIVALRRDNSNEDAFKRSVITWASTNGCPHLLFQVYNIVVGEEDSASDDDDASNSARIDAIVVKSEQGVDAPLAAEQEAMSEAKARTATASSSSSSSSAEELGGMQIAWDTPAPARRASSAQDSQEERKSGPAPAILDKYKKYMSKEYLTQHEKETARALTLFVDPSTGEQESSKASALRWKLWDQLTMALPHHLDKIKVRGDCFQLYVDVQRDGYYTILKAWKNFKTIFHLQYHAKEGVSSLCDKMRQVKMAAKNLGIGESVPNALLVGALLEKCLESPTLKDEATRITREAGKEMPSFEEVHDSLHKHEKTVKSQSSGGSNKQSVLRHAKNAQARNRARPAAKGREQTWQEA